MCCHTQKGFSFELNFISGRNSTRFTQGKSSRKNKYFHSGTSFIPGWDFISLTCNHNFKNIFTFWFRFFLEMFSLLFSALLLKILMRKNKMKPSVRPYKILEKKLKLNLKIRFGCKRKRKNSFKKKSEWVN